MKPIPVVFHIGPLQIHTYGIGLAITFWFVYQYFAKRLRDHGYDDTWLGKAFVWIIIASVIGARAVSVIGTWSIYSHNLGNVFAVWHGGLSSWGGLLGGVPTGFYCARKWATDLRAVVAADLVAPVLAIAWSVGRLLGPQVMYQGGGDRTTAWYGMYYAGQVGRRIPVPIFQAIECAVIWAIALQVERVVARRGGPLGLVATVVVMLYGLSRFFDEDVLLPHSTDGDRAVIVTAIAFVVVGLAFSAWLILRDRRRQELPDIPGLSESEGPPGLIIGDPWAAPPLAGDGENDEQLDQASDDPPTVLASELGEHDDSGTSDDDAGDALSAESSPTSG